MKVTDAIVIEAMRLKAEGVKYSVTARQMNLNYNTLLAKVRKVNKKPYVWAVQLHNGTVVVGLSKEPGEVIASLNAGRIEQFPGHLQVNRIIAIKETTEDRSIESAIKKLSDNYPKVIRLIN